jgi:kumamolisin
MIILVIYKEVTRLPGSADHNAKPFNCTPVGTLAPQTNITIRIVTNSSSNKAIVASYFSSFKSLKAKNSTKKENRLILKGTVADFSNIFNTSFIEYTCVNYTKKRIPYAISSEAYLPESLHAAIVGILGLETIITHAHAYNIKSLKSGRSMYSAAEANRFTGYSAALVYGVPDGTGVGVRVGIVSLGGSFVQTDLQAFFDINGLGTAPIINIVYLDGVTQTSDFASTVENYADVEMIASVAPQANITIYMGINTNQGFYNVLDAALANSDIVSCSWGQQEIFVPISTATSFQALFAAYSNVPVFAASLIHGSYVSFTGDSIGGAGFPASCPNAIG